MRHAVDVSKHIHILVSHNRRIVSVKGHCSRSAPICASVVVPHSIFVQSEQDSAVLPVGGVGIGAVSSRGAPRSW